MGVGGHGVGEDRESARELVEEGGRTGSEGGRIGRVPES